MSTPINPQRDEVWLIDFDPTKGDEIRKRRPAVVLSIHAAWRHRLRIVVPITSWQARFTKDFWMVEITANTTNGLKNNSAANTFQIKSVSEQRFTRKIGVLTAVEMEEIAAAVALCIGFNPTI